MPPTIGGLSRCDTRSYSDDDGAGAGTFAATMLACNSVPADSFGVGKAAGGLDRRRHRNTPSSTNRDKPIKPPTLAPMIKPVGSAGVSSVMSAAALVELWEVVELGAVEGDEAPVSMDLVPGSVEPEGDELAPVALVGQLDSGEGAGNGAALG